MAAGQGTHARPLIANTVTGGMPGGCLAPNWKFCLPLILPDHLSLPVHLLFPDLVLFPSLPLSPPPSLPARLRLHRRGVYASGGVIPQLHHQLPLLMEVAVFPYSAYPCCFKVQTSLPLQPLHSYMKALLTSSRTVLPLQPACLKTPSL